MSVRADTEVDATLTVLETDEFSDHLEELLAGEGDPFNHVNSLTPLGARAYAFALSQQSADVVRSQGYLTTTGILISYDDAAQSVTFDASATSNDFALAKCRLICALGGPDRSHYDALIWHEAWAELDVDDRNPMIHSLLETARGD